VYVAIAVAVSAVVDMAARRTRQAARASAEASTLATVAGSVLRGGRVLTALLEQLRETLNLESVTLLEQVTDTSGRDRQHDPDAWLIAATVGATPCRAPSDGETDVPVTLPDDQSSPGTAFTLVLRGHPLAAADRRIIQAFAAQAVVALRQERLAEEAQTAGHLAEADRMRTALLAAVSHDLRGPLASAKAAITSLRSTEFTFSMADQQELLATADESLDKLTGLVANLLDMSRLQAGALGLNTTEVGFEDIVPPVVESLGAPRDTIIMDLPDDLPAVEADAGLLERILVNVIGNALRYSPPGEPVTITAAEQDSAVELRIIDRGPGIPSDDHDKVFRPFQRLGDRDNTTGVGLGLALSRGLAEAMGGTLDLTPTPGGGVTMILALPSADQPSHAVDSVQLADGQLHPIGRRQ
jgi:two-component system sensor histidine kinase KdpD